MIYLSSQFSVPAQQEETAKQDTEFFAVLLRGYQDPGIEAATTQADLNAATLNALVRLVSEIFAQGCDLFASRKEMLSNIESWWEKVGEGGTRMERQYSGQVWLRLD